MNQARAVQTRAIHARALAFAGITAILGIQVITHLGWLSVSAHSGQTAIPWMMTHGRTLFGDLLEQHAPLSSVLAALAQLAFPTAEPVLIARALNLLYVLLSTILIAYIAVRVAGDRPLAGLAAALCWFWWEPVYGNVLAYFDILLGVLLLSAVAAWLALEGRQDWWAPLASGLLMGLATLAKQHAWAGVAVFGLWLLAGAGVQTRAGRGRAFAVFALGALIFPLLTVAVVTAQGNLARYVYWNWTFNFSGLMAGEAPSGDLIRKLALSSALAVSFALLTARRDLERIRLAPLRRDMFTARTPSTPRNEDAGVPLDDLRVLAVKSTPELGDSEGPGGRGVGWLLVGLWAAAFATLYPRFSLSQSMAHLGLGMAMAGIVIAALWRDIFGGERVAGDSRGGQGVALRTADLVLVGIGIAGLAASLWTGAVVYAPGPLGSARIVAYDEFIPLSDALQRNVQPEDTLFILPETDSTPQIHMMSALLPPGTWIKGWSWYLAAPSVVDSLLSEWAVRPPTLIVAFPDLLVVGQPGIAALTDFVAAHYQLVQIVAAIPLHGDAVIYRLTGDTR